MLEPQTISTHIAQYIVLGLFLFSGILIGVFDFYLYHQYGYSHTVSAIWFRWCIRWPILPFMLGILMGHLLWPGGP